MCDQAHMLEPVVSHTGVSQRAHAHCNMQYRVVLLGVESGGAGEKDEPSQFACVVCYVVGVAANHLSPQRPIVL